MGKALDDLRDIARFDQARQVQHHASAHAGADVGGAGSEVAMLIAGRPAEVLFQLAVSGDRVLWALFEGHAGADTLDPDVIFLITHDGGAFVGCDDHPPGLPSAPSSREQCRRSRNVWRYSGGAEWLSN